MATLLTTTGPTGTALTPAGRGDPIQLPLERESLAAQTSSVVVTENATVSVPILTADADTDWVAEGAALPEGTPTVNEVVLRPVKLAAIKTISNELANDSNPEVLGMLSTSFARSVAAKLDAAFVSSPGTGIPPVGILTTTGVVDGGTLGTTNLDAITNALTTIEVNGGQIANTVIVMNPATWGRVVNLKTASNSAQSLLGAPSESFARQLFGVPVFVDPGVPADSIGVWDKTTVALGMRTPAQFEVSRDAAFSYDSTMVRITLRAAWKALAPSRVVKVKVTTS